MGKLFKLFSVSLISLLFLTQNFKSQTQVFYDNFESGTAKWTLTGTFGTSTLSYHSATKSLTESPSGNYANMQSMSATSTSINLSGFQGSQLSFWAKYNIENAFDYMYLEISKDGGATFVKLKDFTGVSSTWQKYIYNIGTVSGYSNVKIRFRFYSDQYVVADGMFIDDVEVLGTTVDNSAPLIVYNGPEFYQGSQGSFNVTAEITDVSGINSANLYYTVEGSSVNSVSGTSIGGNQFQFLIPAQDPGTKVTFKIRAVDNATPANQTDTSSASKYEYISGTYLSYDNGVVDAVATITGTAAAAVKISVPANMYGKLSTVLIRNYRDTNLSNSDMLFHVWANNNGVPGNDLITPFSVTPEATLDNPFPFTIIDLRSYSDILHDLSGDFFIGYSVPSNSVHMVSSNTSHGRSFTFNGTSWSAFSGDYEMRAIIYQSNSPLPVELTTFTANAVKSNKVLLNWQTATEVNNYGFKIERQNSEFRIQNTDWESIGFIEGHGNSNSPKLYSYEDNSINASGKYLYRLKQIDIDGKYEYSDIVEVNVSAPEDFNLDQNFPNPFNPTTTIKYSIPSNVSNGSSNVKLIVYDVLGKTVATLVNNKLQAGNYEAAFDGSNLPSGIYFYSLQYGNFNKTNKMILMK